MISPSKSIKISVSYIYILRIKCISGYIKNRLCKTSKKWFPSPLSAIVKNMFRFTCLGVIFLSTPLSL